MCLITNDETVSVLHHKSRMLFRTNGRCRLKYDMFEIALLNIGSQPIAFRSIPNGITYVTHVLLILHQIVATMSCVETACLRNALNGAC